MMTMITTVGLQSVQYACTSHAHSAVLVSQRNNKTTTKR